MKDQRQPDDYGWPKFVEQELQFLQETDDLGDIDEAEASYYSIHGHLPGEAHWPKLIDSEGEK